MTGKTAHDTRRYDLVAPRWGDKMRALGYYDGYLGFLTAAGPRPDPQQSVIDIGAGTAAFSEAWVAVHGPPRNLTLLDPSREMLDRGLAALRAHGVDPIPVQALLGDHAAPPVDVVLAAHVIEHCPDPLVALGQMRDLLRPGGRLYLVVSKPHWCNAIIWLQWRHRTFQQEEIVDLLHKAGFDVEQIHDFPAGPPSRTSRGIVAVSRH
ncbi:class I SAM-dependent methyltransferase [Actibacterium sp. XHP0104]|uniref:class I SAM-dependent methyltransferase n=1 Tax=Actibacterium sp. XHP0104 TaxID=2984335 RepID=UPI0021E7789F|nr:class I SAM-dependent methyltransferase [Actibacterium sp. XHP0104]MCV2882055.1 class I SAM-dependent methyltransferase [Actibacterium sp. XHP0104]